MNKNVHAVIAAALSDSHRDGVRRSAAAWGDVLESEDDAYAVQDIVATQLNWFPAGATHVWKSGGASRIDGLSHARLPPALMFPSGADLGACGFKSPYMEAEVVFRLSRDVTAEAARQLTQADAGSLIKGMAPAIEIADSRWQEHWEAPWLLRLADLGSHAALILGEWQPYEPREWGKFGCKVDSGEGKAVRFVGAYGLEDPTWLLPAWLRHATRAGETVPAGAMVTTGSWSGATACARGSRISVEFDGLGIVEASI